MPLQVSGENYRDFTDPRIFEAESAAQVRQIYQPVDKAFAFLGDPSGVANLQIFRFDAASTAGASASVLVPNNPAYASEGRWIEMPLGGGSGTGGAIIGNGSPEGVETADPGQYYWDVAGQAQYVKETGNGDTGWVIQFEL